MKQLRTASERVLGVGTKKMPDVDTTGRFKTKNKKHKAKITKKPNVVFFKVSKLFIECG